MVHCDKIVTDRFVTNKFLLQHRSPKLMQTTGPTNINIFAVREWLFKWTFYNWKVSDMKLYYSYLIFRIINAHLTHLFLKWRYFSFYITFKYALFENNPSVDYLFFTLILILPVTRILCKPYSEYGTHAILWNHLGTP